MPPKRATTILCFPIPSKKNTHESKLNSLDEESNILKDDHASPFPNGPKEEKGGCPP